MKTAFTSHITLVLAAMHFLFISPDASAARHEHRPVCSPDGSRLIYMLKNDDREDDWELYAMELDSRVHSRLTFHPGWDGYAVWSPDGTKIIYDREDVFSGQKRPWIMDMEGRTSKPLGSYEGWLSVTDWSDDNRLLGFHETGGQRDLVILDSSGNIVERVTETVDHSEHDAHFSPDGAQIAFANGVIDGSETTLELIDLESGSTTILRTSIGRIYGISWSHDGKKIAFVDAPGGDDDDADIFIYTPGDESFTQVTDDPSRDHMPEYCADSQTLLFTSNRSGAELIYRIDPGSRPYLQIIRALN